MAPKPAHIAVIRLSALGDVAMTVPVLLALADAYPTLKITVVSRPLFAPFFKAIPNVSFFAADLKNRHKGFPGLFRLYRDLKGIGVDVFADFHHVLRSKVVRSFFRMSGVPVAHIDKGRAEKKALTRSENKIFKPLKSTFERYADVLRELDFPIDLTRKYFLPKPEFSPETLQRISDKKSTWIGIAPFAQHQGKVYPSDLMQQTIDGLAKENVMIFLFGAGKTESDQLDQFASGKENVMNLAGKLGLEKELEIISRLDVMLSMDSGNAHLAAMYGVPVVTLWGATHPYAGFLPYNQPMENALTADREKYPLLPTSVYGNKEVPGYEYAMRTITPEQVIRQTLNSTRAAGELY